MRPAANLRGVVRSAGIIGLITILVRFLSFGREIVAAAVFGVGADLDVFLIAYLVPAFLFYSILACAGPSIIPTLMMAQEKGGHEALRTAVARANGTGLVGFCGLALLAALLSPLYLPLLASHVTPEKMQLAQHWLLLLCLLVPFYGFAALWTAVANAQGSFAAPAAIPFLSPAVTIFMLYAYANEQGAGAFVKGMLSGAALEVVAMGIVLYRRGLLVAPRVGFAADSGFERAFGTLFAGAAILGLIPATDQAMATGIGTGAITGIIFGGRLVALTGSVGALALGAAVLPAFATLVASGDRAGLRRLVYRCVLLTLGLALPVCAFISWFSQPITELMFQRGQFSTEDTNLVAGVQAFYILQIPFYLAWIVLARVLAAMGHGFQLLLLSAGAALLNVILNYYFIPGGGAEGIAAATSVVFFLLFLATLCAARHYLSPVKQAQMV